MLGSPAVELLSGKTAVDDALIVSTRLTEVTGATIVLAQRVRRDDIDLVTADVVVVLVNVAGRPQRIPSQMRTQLLAVKAASAAT